MNAGTNMTKEKTSSAIPSLRLDSQTAQFLRVRIAEEMI